MSTEQSRKRICRNGHEVSREGECSRCRQAQKTRREARLKVEQPEKYRLWKQRKNRRKMMRGVPAEAARPGDPCECCGAPMKRPNADHDHATGRFRGWLCQRCNLGLGYLEHPGFVKSAIDYLAKPR